MASNGDDNLNTPVDTSMAAPTESVKKKRGRPRKSENDSVTPRKSVRQAEKKQLKKETVSVKLKGLNGGELDSEEEWSFDEEDDDYVATMFRKLNNSVPGVVEEEQEEEEEDDEEEDDEEEDEEEEEEEEEDALFQEDSKDVYDFDQQSSVMSQQGAKVTRRWLNQQNKRSGVKQDPREGSSWGSNIYSHVATLLNTREDLDTYSRFLKCGHVNRGLDTLLAELCKPFRAADGPSASLRSLVSASNDSVTVVNLVREIVSDRFDNAAHRVTHFVGVVKQPICGLRFCTASADTLHFTDTLHCIDPKMNGDSAFIVETDKTDLKRSLADVDTLVVSDSLWSHICDQILSSTANKLQRVVVGIEENKALFGVFILDYWNRAGVPYNRPRKYGTATGDTVTAESAVAVTHDCTNLEFIDAFFVRMGPKKDIVHLVVAKPDSRFLVYNIVSEYSFAFKKHGLAPTTPIMLEGMFSTFPEVLAEEKSVIVVPDQLYRSLAKTLAKEVASPACKFKKCVLLDKRTRLPLALFFDSEVQITVTGGGDGAQSSLTAMLVSLNGVLVGLEVVATSVGKSVTKCYELASDSSAILQPEKDRRQSLETTYLCSSTVTSVTVQLASHDNSEHQVVMASLYDNVPYCKRQEMIDHVINDTVDRLYDLPVQASLLDAVLRAHLARTVISGGPSAAPDASAVKCVFCDREFRTGSIYDHEARHLGLVKYKCHKHQMWFNDQKTYRSHRDEYLNCGDTDSSDRDHDTETHKLLNIAATITDCPQCHKCYDYFPGPDLLAEHGEVCDGVSFQARTPLDTGDLVASGECSVCGLCGLSYPRAESLCAHMTGHVTCHVCKTRMAGINEVSAHLRDHVSRHDAGVSGRGIRKVLVCDVCGHFYGTKANYYYHQWTEHGVVHPPIKSEDGGAGADTSIAGGPGTPGGSGVRQRRVRRSLGATTSSSSALAYNATGHKKFRCKFCAAEVKVSGKTYVKHLDIKHGLEVDQDCVCRICAEVFETCERLSDHLHDKHLRSGQYVNAGIQSIFSCDKCTFFGHWAGVVAHSTTVHCDPTPCLYECPHCSERMLDRRLWRVHLERAHPHAPDATVEHGCARCSLQFKTELLLAAHESTNHGEATAPILANQIIASDNTPDTHIHCDICQKTCKTHKALEVHRLKHFRTKIFQCNECQATFRSKLAMRRHVRVDHLNLEPERYECQICGKIVTQISMHMLIHKNARYQCEFCDKRFTKSAYYNEHVRIHRGEKPYECHICQRKFNKKSNLNVHISFHEKHRDDYGNYLEIKPRGRGHPDYDPEKTRARKTAMIKYDAACGPDEPLVLSDYSNDRDYKYKAINVLTNSKSCDTDDLSHYIQLLAAHNDEQHDQDSLEPDIKRQKCVN